MAGCTNIEKNLLKTLVPVNSLTEDHLDTLLRDTCMEVVYPGQKVFSIGQWDRKTIYLLSGQVSIKDSAGGCRILNADDPECQFPLLNMQPRTFDVTATNDCLLIRFDSDGLDRMLAWDQASTYLMLDINASRDMDEDAAWLMTLLRSNLFYKVPPMNIRKIINQFESVYFSAGETVIRQGEFGDACYYVKEGVVEVFQSLNDYFPPEPVNKLGPGKCFGEDALISNAPRNATIVMKTNGVLMKLDRQSFYQLLKTPSTSRLSLSDALAESSADCLWIDVRTQEEYESGHYEGAINMPLNLLKLKSRMIKQGESCIIYCDSGRRSEAAAYFLAEEGFNSRVMSGGISSCNASQRLNFSFSLQA